MALSASYHSSRRCLQRENDSMPDVKECPLCGESMRLKTRELTDSVPGTGQTSTRTVREWVCPECDYWEEAESSERGI
jgi:C4-type Zn-finger protein